MKKRPLSWHLEIIEKDPDTRELSISGLDPIIPYIDPMLPFTSSTLGVKWSIRGTWYGFWGEYAPHRRRRAWLQMAILFVWYALLKRDRRPKLLEAQEMDCEFSFI